MGRYKQWNGLLEWNTGLDYWTELFFFLDRFMCLFLHFAKYLATMDDSSNDNHFLQCFHKYILNKTPRVQKRRGQSEAAVI